MRRLSTAAAGIVALLTVIAGCGQRNPPSDAARSPAPVNCVHRVPQGRATIFSITQSDNGKTFCVTEGTGMLVFLHGTLARRWSPIESSSSAVVARPAGMMSLAIGVTGGFFRALRAGKATLTSVRSPCHAVGSGCPAGTSFRVTVQISAPRG